MLLHLLISTKRISRTSYTSLHSFREIYQFCFHNVKQRGISLILLDSRDNGQSQVTSSNSSSLSFIVLVLIGTPWNTSVFTSFTILLWSVRDTGLNPVEAKFFFQASSLKILELPLPCEGPLFTWMSFVWQPRFIYLKKKNRYTSLCRGKWGAREQNAMASGSAEPGCFVPESSALIVKLPPVSHTISFNLSISLSFLRTRNATPSFYVPSVISKSL